MKHFIMLLTCFLMFSCASDGGISDTTDTPLPAKDDYNIAYGTHAQQKYDIYLPPGRSAATTKVFIFIHGGGWVGGDKADYNGGIPVMKQTYFPKYAIVNMNYVLGNVFTPGYALPNQIDDIQAVINHIKARSQEYQVKPEFVLCGNSAGGHLSMFYGYKQQNPEIKAVVNIVGPTDFNLPSFTANPLNAFFTNLVNPSVVPQGMTKSTYASPITWVSNSSPPTISFYGATDITVDADENKASLDAKLIQAGFPNESHIYNGDHNAWGAEPHLSWMLGKTKAFLNSYNP